jgi:tubulin-specific chaperone A
VTRQKIVLAEVPADYIKISSSLGVTEPRSIVVLPFFFDDKVKGVLELGALHEFNDFHLGFLDEIGNNIGMAINLCQAREHTAQLLEQTRIQAAELQAQQEELRVTNEELQEQTEVLKESEETLQSQQEELQVANEELEERTRTLEKQRDAIHRQNEALEKAKIDIQQKARDLEMASRYKSEFLANMSHELRTPLNSMLILSHLLTDGVKNNNLTKKQLDYAATIHSSGQDLLHLINEILDLSKVEAGKLTFTMAPLTLAELGGSCEGLFREVAAGKGLTFTVELASDAPAQIETDGRRLLQILNNFLSNAFKFTDKGSVTLRIYRPNAAELGEAVAGLNCSKCIAIAVTDTGIGVPPEKHQAIFEAFQQADGTTSRKYGGTGLGLSISRELAWVLGGEIRMTSVEGNGSTFTLYLPERPECSMPSVPSPAAVPADLEPSALARRSRPRQDQDIQDDRYHLRPSDKSLLIIEDDAAFAQVVLELGKEAGFQCLVAEDGETGLHFADFYKPSAIILDIGLPGIDGWQVMERLKSNPSTRHIPVHFISGHDTPMEAMKMGAIGYLTKPIDAKALQDVFHNLEQVLARRARRLLIVEDNAVLRQSLVELIGNGDDVITTDVGSGTEALAHLDKEPFDCMILDLGLADMTGFDLLARMRERSLANLPIIIYTGKALTRDEEENLQQYADSIIVKGVKSPERLLAETTLFLHRVEADLPEEKQQMLRMVHNREAMLIDKKIMVVDDDMRNLYALTGLLEGKGMQVVVARDGREGLARLTENPDIDLVLMDIMMPEMDGYVTISEIRKQREFAKLPIIALTAKAMRGDRNKCIEAGANDYLPKPIDSEKLLSLLRVWLYQ